MKIKKADEVSSAYGCDGLGLYVIILAEHNHPQQGAYKHSDTTQNQ